MTPVGYRLDWLPVAVSEYSSRWVIPCPSAGTPVSGSAICLSSLAGTPGPVPFLIFTRPVILSESWPVFGPGRLLVLWLETGPPLSKGGICILRKMATGQLSPSPHCFQRTPPLEVYLHSHSTGSWRSLGNTVPLPHWYFLFGCPSEGGIWLTAFVHFLAVHRRSSKVQIWTVVLDQRCLSGVNRVDTIHVGWIV